MSFMTKTRVRPIAMVVLIDILGFLLLYLFNRADSRSVLYVGAAMCAVNIVVYSVIYFADMGDGYLFLMVSMLVSIGMIMMFRLDFSKGFHQMQWFLVGIGIMFCAYIVYRAFKRWDSLAYFYMALTAVMFLVTLIFGETIHGSRNWINIGGKSFQPSEIIKIFYAFTLACFFSKSTGNGTEKNQTERRIFGVRVSEWQLMIYVYMCLGFFVIQREWGTAVLFVLMYFTMMLLYDSTLRLRLINIVLAAIGGVGGYFLTDHIRVRVSTWLDPWADATNKGFQITQSLIAIASGGFFGAGLGNGDPYLIPEVHSDFIFSAICEEMGLFMGIAIIMLYFIFSYRGFKIALKAKNEFNRALSLALVISFAYQTFIIVGGVIKMIPLTGITLPFVSYGGSSMVSCFIMLGLLTAISHYDA